jgi:hypothetical protein
MEKKVSTPVTVGIVLSLVIIVWSIVVYLTGLYMQTWSQYVGLVIMVGGILYGVLNHGKEKNHEVTFGNLFGFGFKVAAVATCLVILYSILSNLSANQEQVEKGMEMFEKNYNLFIVIFIVFWYLVIGVITSLIGAAIAKKNPPTPFDFDKKP